VLENTMTKESNAANKKEEFVPYSKLGQIGSSADNCFKYIGLIGSALAGFTIPSFVFIMGDILDALDPKMTAEDSF
jgi:hypothetical protein